MAEQETTQVRIYTDDKPFFLGNEKLEEYLSFKHKKLAKKQEELFALIRKELEEILNKKR